jgi:hypothetical protein
MKNKNKVLLGGGIAAVAGLFTLGIKNIKRVKHWFEDDYHKHKMATGCVCNRVGSYKICPKCYKCEDCKTNRCKKCK